MKIIVLLITLFSISCLGNVNIIAKTDAGKIIKITPVITSFNEKIKTHIETTEGSFVVIGTISVLKGTKAHIETYGDNRSYLCVEGKDSCRYIIGF